MADDYSDDVLESFDPLVDDDEYGALGSTEDLRLDDPIVAEGGFVTSTGELPSLDDDALDNEVVYGIGSKGMDETAGPLEVPSEAIPTEDVVYGITQEAEPAEAES